MENLEQFKIILFCLTSFILGAIHTYALFHLADFAKIILKSYAKNKLINELLNEEAAKTSKTFAEVQSDFFGFSENHKELKFLIVGNFLFLFLVTYFLIF